MDIAAIKALPISAADDCVVFLWATVPMLPAALEVLAAWGFAYESLVVWKTDRAGAGYWVRNRVELLLIGTRGDVPAPAPGARLPQVIEAPRGRHSEKPAIFAELIERLYPNVPKLEMFARARRDGWDSWGMRRRRRRQRDKARGAMSTRRRRPNNARPHMQPPRRSPTI